MATKSDRVMPDEHMLQRSLLMRLVRNWWFYIAIVLVFAWVFVVLRISGCKQELLPQADMRDPVRGRRVAVKLAQLCRSELALSWNAGKWSESECVRLVPVLARTPGRLRVFPHWAEVYMGGGFSHYGYYLGMDELTSASAEYRWHLYLIEEGRKVKIVSITTLATSGLTDDDIRTQERKHRLGTVDFPTTAALDAFIESRLSQPR